MKREKKDSDSSRELNMFAHNVFVFLSYCIGQKKHKKKLPLNPLNFRMVGPTRGVYCNDMARHIASSAHFTIRPHSYGLQIELTSATPSPLPNGSMSPHKPSHVFTDHLSAEAVVVGFIKCRQVKVLAATL